MLIEITPFVFNIIFGCAFTFIGGMIGYYLSNYRKEDIIETTIVYLVENGFAKAKRIDGELELIKLDSIDNEE